MKWAVYLTLVAAAVSQAAEPTTEASDAIEAPVDVTAAKRNEGAPRKPLDLRLGDIRRYITPEDYRALMNAPAMEANTVIVQADAPLLPVRSDEPVPAGIMAPFWALAHPTQAWRLLVPDLKRPPDGPPDTKVPPPVFRWGP
jgi:hypothetical protein